MTLTTTQAESLAAIHTAVDRGLIAPDTAACAMIVAAKTDAAIFLSYDNELKVFEPDAPTFHALPFADWWRDYGAKRAAKLAIAAQQGHSAA